MSSPPSSPRSHFDPDSSPESSPAFGPIDSSPPSSPSVHPISLSPPASPGLPHPYAASTKASKPPRLYEKRDTVLLGDYSSFNLNDCGENHNNGLASLMRPALLWGLSPQRKHRAVSSHARSNSGASTSSLATQRPRDPLGTTHDPFLRVSRRSPSSDSRDELAAIDLSDDEGFTTRQRAPSKSRRQREQDLWDEVITKAIDSANGYIDLQQEGLISAGLTFIPSSIADLASLVVLPSSEKSQTFAPYSSVRAPVPRARPFVRSVTVPSGVLHRSMVDPEHRLAKSSSVNFRDVFLTLNPTPKADEIVLELGNNSIRNLPLELFWLKNLTVLSMRNNFLTHLPPQIALLINLRELNVTQNRLAYLPAEMLEMKLEVLKVDHNPWRQPPLPPENTLRDAIVAPGSSATINTSRRTLRRVSSASQDRSDPFGADQGPSAISASVIDFTIPSLTECCLRALLAPNRSSNALSDPTLPSAPTRLEAMYALPLSDIEHYPAPVVETLRACVPQAVANPDPHLQASPSKRARRSSTRSRVNSVQSDVFGDTVSDIADVPEGDDDGDDGEEIPPGIGTCMSPVHPQHARPVFVGHAVERFAWVHTIASQPVHEEAGVPVRWRGCMPNCLGFLGDGTQFTVDSRNRDEAVVEEEDVWKMSSAESDGETSIEAIDLGGGFGEHFD